MSKHATEPRVTLIVGCGPLGRATLGELGAAKAGGSVIGFVDDAMAAGTPVTALDRVGAALARRGTTSPKRASSTRANVLGKWSDLGRLIGEHRATEVLVTCPLTLDRVGELRDLARATRARIVIMPEHRGGEGYAARGVLTDESRLLVVRPGTGSSNAGAPRAHERLFDIVGASLLVVLTSPLWIASAVMIRRESRGPLFFRQERVGRDGRRFCMWKFRTMRVEVDPYAKSVPDDDAKVTRAGRALRPTGLDELPQLLNVLRGDMRLVGPRPEMPFIVDRYSARERERLALTPGITGPWQLNGDRSRPIHEQLEYDFHYIAHRSLAADVRILAETVSYAARKLLEKARGEEPTAEIDERGSSQDSDTRRPRRGARQRHHVSDREQRLGEQR